MTPSLFEYLTLSLTEEQKEVAVSLKKEKNTEKETIHWLINKQWIKEETILQYYAEKYQLEMITEIDFNQIDSNVYRQFEYIYVKTHQILPLYIEDETVVAITWMPTSRHEELLKFIFEMPIRILFTSQLLFNQATIFCFDQKKTNTLSENKLIETYSSEASGDTIDLLDHHTDSQIANFVNQMINEAIEAHASDIHLESSASNSILRFRIDGNLQKKVLPSHLAVQQLIARIKVLAKLDIAQSRLPQDGSIKIQKGDRHIDLRISTIPCILGERVVIRILDKGNIALTLDELGMPETVKNNLKQLLSIPEGMILVTGPTGSGKTTTLYSALCDLKSTEKNIITIEDPVEYKIKGISQIHVDPKIDLTFSKGLRHILRQDPDVIMVGEIRDQETAEIAIRSSLTGHLVLSTLHTSDAPSTVLRLIDMGIEPFLIASSIKVIIAQRLARKLCPYCKYVEPIDIKLLHSLGMAHHQADFYNTKGCDKCHHTGFIGRCGLFEFMPIKNGIRAAILQQKDNFSIRQIAMEEGMETLEIHAQKLLLQGFIHLNEYITVTQGYSSELLI